MKCCIKLGYERLPGVQNTGYTHALAYESPQLTIGNHIGAQELDGHRLDFTQLILWDGDLHFICVDVDVHTNPLERL